MVARVLIALLLALTACKRKSEKWCEMHPGDLDNCGYLDAGVDARPTCNGDPDCAGSPGAPYCELNTHFCVECYLPDHCVNNAVEKFCDLQTFLCTSCVRNSDCPSEICLPTGVCGDDTNVAYVDPATGVDNALCSLAKKCKTVMAALETMKQYVKLQGMIQEAVVVAQNVTFVAEPGTTLTRAMNGVVMAIAMGSDVAIFDLTIVGAAEKGIDVGGNSTLRLTRVTITNCNGKDHRALEVKDSTLIMSRSTIAANAGGGILVDSKGIYQITNSFIFRNGMDNSMVSGATLAPTSSTFNHFEFNTVIDNHGAAAIAGVECSANIAAPNNIVARNYSAGVNTHLPAASTQTGGSCNFAQSLQATDLELLAFVMPDGTGPWDYHLSAGSMAIDRGVDSEISTDVDGDPRPMGAKVDVGADEFKQ